jgi:hypothetical protein
MEMFRPLTSNADPAIRLIGDAGMEAMEEELRRALKKEREEAVHGR